MKTLIIYYSRTGNTRKIANELKSQLNSNIEEITESFSRKGFFGFMKSGFQEVFNRKNDIKKIKTNLNQYDLIIVGTPTWVGKVSIPIATFLEDKRREIGRVAFFSTSGDKRVQKVFKNMKLISGKNPIATLHLYEEEIEKDNYSDKITNFVKAITSE